jgi:dihydrodipicolinate synthase/N-acetylneuraminate lyase
MYEKRYPRTILATACIPWTEGFEIDEMLFRAEIRGLLHRGIRHIYLFGTAGEGYAVTEELFEKMVRVFAEEMDAPDRFAMVGLISLSLPSMIQRVQKAYALGIRDFQFALPSWGALQDAELDRFVHLLCDPFPDCRFMHYNLLRAKRILTIHEYERLADEVPNLVAVKYVTTDIPTIQEIARSSCPLRFFFTEQGFGYGSLVGEFGYLLSIGTTRIERAWDYFHAAVDGRSQSLLDMQVELAAMAKGLLDRVGRTMIDAAYDKVFCKILDTRFPLRLMPPYTCTSEEGYRKYLGFLEDQYPQWLE